MAPLILSCFAAFSVGFLFGAWWASRRQTALIVMLDPEVTREIVQAAAAEAMEAEAEDIEGDEWKRGA